MIGIPVLVLNAGINFSARSNAFANNPPPTVSPPSLWVAISPPRMRIVHSKTFAFLSASNVKEDVIHARASFQSQVNHARHVIGYDG
jgi:hypothetical protein